MTGRELLERLQQMSADELDRIVRLDSIEHLDDADRVELSAGYIDLVAK